MKTLVAMSGGVDSAVSAYLESKKGEAIGVTMKLHSDTDKNIYLSNSCCTDEDISDAKKICDSLKIEHLVYDFGSDFANLVINDFCSCYINGDTPNPCIVCNRKIKFGKLLSLSSELGFDKIATGHYAKVEKAENGRYLLKKSADPTKDQTYVLYTLTQEQLSKIDFPLGNMKKSEVRDLAESLGFSNARKHDSQDICFIPDGDYVSFIDKYFGYKDKEGNFVDKDGKILGKHEGLIKYTIGQRKGLKIALGEPAYVISKNQENNTVTLGKNEDLFTKVLTAHDINLIPFDKIDGNIRLYAKVRYKHQEQIATVTQIDVDKIRVEFDEPQRAITSGQSVVLYDGDIVVGGGIID